MLTPRQTHARPKKKNSKPILNQQIDLNSLEVGEHSTYSKTRKKKEKKKEEISKQARH